jgi:hypothetical protein|tara:strand:- start:3082 stop:3294 length:213 start_codon:yes stop_codon:yes gene_type:complete
MKFIMKRLGLLLYGFISICESVVNTMLYITLLDVVFKPVDWAFPFYFKYSDTFLKGSYLSNLKRSDGTNV